MLPQGMRILTCAQTSKLYPPPPSSSGSFVAERQSDTASGYGWDGAVKARRSGEWASFERGENIPLAQAVAPAVRYLYTLLVNKKFHLAPPKGWTNPALRRHTSLFSSYLPLWDGLENCSSIFPKERWRLGTFSNVTQLQWSSFPSIQQKFTVVCL